MRYFELKSKNHPKKAGRPSKKKRAQQQKLVEEYAPHLMNNPPNQQENNNKKTRTNWQKGDNRDRMEKAISDWLNKTRDIYDDNVEVIEDW